MLYFCGSFFVCDLLFRCSAVFSAHFGNLFRPFWHLLLTFIFSAFSFSPLPFVLGALAESLGTDVLAGICKLWIINWKESIIHSKNECLGTNSLRGLFCIYEMISWQVEVCVEGGSRGEMGKGWFFFFPSLAFSLCPPLSQNKVRKINK